MANSIHSGYSFVAALDTRSAVTAARILEGWKGTTCNRHQPMFALSSSTIFVTATVIPAQPYGKETLPPTLLFLTSFYGSLDKHLRELVTYYHRELCALFSCCIKWQDAITCEGGNLRQFMLQQKHPDTFYTGMQWIKGIDINREDELRKSIRQHIENKLPLYATLNARTVWEDIKVHFNSLEEFKWIIEHHHWTLSGHLKLFRKLYLAILLLPALMIVPFLIWENWYKWGGLLIIFIPVVLIVVLFRRAEGRREEAASRPPDALIKKIMETQCHPIINEMTVANSLKQGWIRRLVFWLVLGAVSLYRGRLKIPTIATARWMAIDKAKRLVFVSNFSGLAEFYIRDFIDNRGSAKMINVIFGNGLGFPATRCFFKSGVLDNQQGFMHAVSRAQHPTQFWYWPHKHLSVDNINNNHRIRVGLAKKNLTEKAARQWLLSIQ